MIQFLINLVFFDAKLSIPAFLKLEKLQGHKILPVTLHTFHFLLLYSFQYNPFLFTGCLFMYSLLVVIHVRVYVCPIITHEPLD